MRTTLLALAIAAGLGSLSGLAGCTSNPNDPAIQAMNNPPNSCGPGGTRDINACGGRGR